MDENQTNDTPLQDPTHELKLAQVANTPEQQQEQLSLAADKLIGTLVETKTGLKTKDEELAASHALTEFGGVLGKVIETRLHEVTAENDELDGIGIVIEETSTEIELVTRKLLDQLGDSNKFREISEHIRVSRLGRFLGRVAFAAAAGGVAWAATKGLDMSVKHVAELGAVAGFVGQETLTATNRKISSRLFRHAEEKIIDPEEEKHVREIYELQKLTGREIKGNERAGILYWLESMDQSRDVRNKLHAFVGKRLTTMPKTVALSVVELAGGFKDIVIDKLSKMYGIRRKVERKRMGIGEVVGDTITDTMDAHGSPVASSIFEELVIIVNTKRQKTA